MSDVFLSHLDWSSRGGHSAAPGALNRLLDVEAGTSFIPMSAAPAYGGDPTRTNPEQLVVAAVSACHALTYLYLAAKQGISVVRYTDDAEGHLGVIDGKVRMTRIVLHPRVTLGEGADRVRAEGIVTKAHAHCIIANSLTASVEIQPDFERRAA